MPCFGRRIHRRLSRIGTVTCRRYRRPNDVYKMIRIIRMCILQEIPVSFSFYLATLVQRSNGKGTCIALDNPDNDTENTQGRCENLNNQNLDKEGRILCIGNGTG